MKLLSEREAGGKKINSARQNLIIDRKRLVAILEFCGGHFSLKNILAFFDRKPSFHFKKNKINLNLHGRYTKQKGWKIECFA